MKNLIRKILKESAEEKFINTIVSRLKPPYFKNLKKFPVSTTERKKIFKMIFGEHVTIKSNGTVFDSTGNKIYHEESDGYWEKREYDDRGNQIYHENSGGFWIKRKYDEMGNKISYEDSSGEWEKWEYDERGNKIYHEDSDGYLEKREYDEMGNKIYHEDSIYGVLIDKR